MKKCFTYLSCMMMVVFFASCHEKSKLSLGSDYYLMGDKEDSASVKLVHALGNSFDDVILGEIVDYNRDPKFILIHRKVTEKAKALFEESPLWEKQSKYPDQFWIIDEQYDGINGPLNYAEYVTKRKQLQISDGVNIK